MSSAIDDKTVWSRASCGLGDLALHHSKYGEAIELYEAAAEAADSAGSEPEKAQAMLGLARVTVLMGDPQQSMSRLEQALILERRLGDRWGVAYVLNEMGLQARRAGRLDQALRVLEESHVLWRQSGTRMGERASVMNLALVTLELGRVQRAAELARDGLELSQDVGDIGSTAAVRCIEVAAQALGALDATVTAVRLIASATTRRSHLDAPRPSTEETEIRTLLDGARDRLGESEFEAAWLGGRDLAVRDAVDLGAEQLTECLETSAPAADFDHP